MTVKELFDKVNHKALLETMYELYPNQEENHEGYVQALFELNSLEPQEEKPTCRVVIDHIYHEYEAPYDHLEPDDYINVSGVDPEAAEDEYGRSGEDITWAIEYQPWTEWLAMDFECRTDDPRCDSELKQAAHILYEMTFAGYTQTDVANQMAEIQDSTDELDKLLETKGYDQAVADGDLIPLDDIIEKIDRIEE